MGADGPLLGGRKGGLENWDWVRPISAKGCLDSSWASQFPLATKGRYVVNANGERFRLRGVNWYGASDVNHAVGGLDTQSLEVICQSVYDLGFNVVRLPFSNEMLREGLPKEGSIDYTKNPRLRGLTALQVYDEVVRSLGRVHVAVIINNHTTYGEFCGPPSRNSLWFDPYTDFSEEQWIRDWLMMARRYSQCTHVVGFDLRNEIRPRKSRWPAFRGGSSKLEDLSGECNWARASRACAERLMAVSSHALLVVERIVWPQQGLELMAEEPGPLLPALRGRLVLGAHLYAWSGPGRFIPQWSVPPRFECLFGVLRSLGAISPVNYGDMTPERLAEQVKAEFGGLLAAARCPVWVSEFGADAANPEEMLWVSRFIDVLAELDADWAYWPLNVGLKPGTDADEAYGMLGADWRPKPKGDYRLVLLERIGLRPPPDAIAAPPLTAPPPPALGGGPLRRISSKESSRSLLGSKDPLLAVKSTGDVKGALLAFVPAPARTLVLGMRRVQTADAELASIGGSAAREWHRPPPPRRSASMGHGMPKRISEEWDEEQAAELSPVRRVQMVVTTGSSSPARF